VILGMIVGLFPDARERARAMGVYAFVGAAGASLGLLLGGVLTETVGWRWIFLVNVPVGIAAVLLVRRTIAPDGARDRTVRPDALGGVLVTLGLMVGVFAIVEAPAPRLVLAALAVALLGGFVVRQRYAPQPLVPLTVFRSRSVSAGNIVQLLIVAGMLGFQFVAALYLQQVLGYGAAATGLAMVPIPVVIAAVSLLVAGRVIGRVGPRPVLLAGEVLLVAGLLLLARPTAGVYLTDVLPALVLLGVGAGLTLPAVTTVIMSDATPATAGLASGLANTSQQVGGALGTAVLATLAAARTDAVLDADPVAALGEGYRLAFAAGGVLVAVATVLTLALPRAVRP
jgi:MFS family permease